MTLLHPETFLGMNLRQSTFTLSLEKSRGEVGSYLERFRGEVASYLERSRAEAY